MTDKERLASVDISFMIVVASKDDTGDAKYDDSPMFAVEIPLKADLNSVNNENFDTAGFFEKSITNSGADIQLSEKGFVYNGVSLEVATSITDPTDYARLIIAVIQDNPDTNALLGAGFRKLKESNATSLLRLFNRSIMASIEEHPILKALREVI